METRFGTSQNRYLIPLALLLVGLLVVPATAQRQPQPSTLDLFSRQNQVGIRLGGWISTGDNVPRETFTDPGSGESVEADIASGSFIAEAFYCYRAWPNVAFEFSFGLSNRGDVISITLTPVGDIRDIGTLNIYPILLQGIRRRQGRFRLLGQTPR